MTFQLPEPTHTNPAGKPFYTEAQLKQALKDVLEQAAQACDAKMLNPVFNLDGAIYAGDCAFSIRKMIGEIK